MWSTPVAQSPSIPLFPGENLLARFSSSPEAMARVIRYNSVVLLIVLPIVLVPALVVAFTGPFNPIEVLLFLPILLVGGMMLLASSAAGRRPPSVLFLTDRRVILQRTGAQGSTAAMGLENLGRVEVQGSSWGARRAGVAWVDLLPVGTTSALVGGGRSRHAAPGVLWLPAVPAATAEEIRDRITRQASAVQAAFGYPGGPARAPPMPPPSPAPGR